MERKLASIQKIIKIEPIPNADSIEKATVLGWECVVKKGEFKEGDFCVYIEIDSIVPELECFEFLRDRKFRVRTIKLRKQISQGLIMPLDILPNSCKICEDKDITEVLGIKKYDPQADAEKAEQDRLNSIHKNRADKFFKRYGWYRRIFKKNTLSHGFPHFIKKTDETRIQLIPFICQDTTREYTYTEKLDGQSATYALIRNRKHTWEFWKPEFLFVVCSRNLHLRKPDTSTYWRIAKQYNIEKILKLFIGNDEFIILQGEIIGEGIQGNKYGIKGIDFYAFNFIIPPYKHFHPQVASKHLLKYGIKWVPILGYTTVKNTIPETVELAKGKSKIADIQREGIVMRDYKDWKSFKIINPIFLLTYEE